MPFVILGCLAFMGSICATLDGHGLVGATLALTASHCLAFYRIDRLEARVRALEKVLGVLR